MIRDDLELDIDSITTIGDATLKMTHLISKLQNDSKPQVTE